MDGNPVPPTNGSFVFTNETSFFFIAWKHHMGKCKVIHKTNCKKNVGLRTSSEIWAMETYPDDPWSQGVTIWNWVGGNHILYTSIYTIYIYLDLPTRGAKWMIDKRCLYKTPANLGWKKNTRTGRCWYVYIYISLQRISLAKLNPSWIMQSIPFFPMTCDTFGFVTAPGGKGCSGKGNANDFLGFFELVGGFS